jgi:hypothetical protein
LTININGSNFPIPAQVGINGGCNRPLHTHDGTGTIHVETDDDRDYTLHDFFLIWGNWASDPTKAIFTPNQLFTNHVASPHTLTITVNNNPPVPADPNLQIPRNSGSASTPCSPGPCQPFAVIITYQ